MYRATVLIQFFMRIFIKMAMKKDNSEGDLENLAILTNFVLFCSRMANLSTTYFRNCGVDCPMALKAQKNFFFYL